MHQHCRYFIYFMLWDLNFLSGKCAITDCVINNNNNNNQYIYKQRQSHAMSQRRWLATAVIFCPSDMSLGFAETWTVIAPVTAEMLEGGSRALVHRWRKPVDQWLSETAAPIGHLMTRAGNIKLFDIRWWQGLESAWNDCSWWEQRPQEDDLHEHQRTPTCNKFTPTIATMTSKKNK